MELSERIKELREAAGMTQMSLAIGANTQPSYISLIENGKVRPGVDILNSIARVLGTTMDTLINGVEDTANAASE